MLSMPSFAAMPSNVSKVVMGKISCAIAFVFRKAQIRIVISSEMFITGTFCNSNLRYGIQTFLFRSMSGAPSHVITCVKYYTLIFSMCALVTFAAPSKRKSLSSP